MRVLWKIAVQNAMHRIEREKSMRTFPDIDVYFGTESKKYFVEHVKARQKMYDALARSSVGRAQ